MALLLTMSACDGDDGPGVPPPIEVNTAQYVSARSDLSTLNTALQAADLTGTLEEAGSVTVFAPTNDAFSSVNVDALTGDTDLLTKILTSHVVTGEALTADGISDGATVTTESGATITFSVTEDGDVQLDINGSTATVQTTDLETTNGVIHIIDGVLVGNTSAGERAKATAATSTLSTALSQAGLESTLDGDGPFTVFAPVNDAFSGVNVEALLAEGNADLLSEVLTYHVVEGSIAAADITDGQTVTTVDGDDLTFGVGEDGTVTINGSTTVATADVQTTNGVIHLVDNVLLETLPIPAYATATAATESLAGAVSDAGLAGTLGGNGPFTVFAPVNAAFGALDVNGDGTVSGDELDGPLRERVLTYHVVGEDIPLVGSGISDGGTRATLDMGQNLTFSAEADTLTAVNGVEIMGTVEAANGTIHLVGDVLLQSTNIVQRAQLDPNLTALVDAVTTGNLAGTLGDENNTFTVFAPPNGAFSLLNTDAFTGMEGSETLAADLVSYHAIAGEVLAEDVPNGEVQSVEGTNLTLRQFADGAVEVNGIPVTTADIQVRNGVIHLIDGVLLQSLNIAQRATVEPALTTLAAAAEAAGLASGAGTLGDDDATFTVFAPTNDAFGALDVEDVTGNQALVTDLLQYHVVSGSALSADAINNGDTQGTLEGDDVEFSVSSDGSVSVNGVPVSTADIQTANGIVHVIDGVLLSELNVAQRVIADPAFSILQTAVTEAGLVGTLDDDDATFTVFAPTNDAFLAALDGDDSGAVEPAELPNNLADILLYHVVSGQAIASGDIMDEQTVTTATGSPDGTDLTFGVNGGVTVNPDDEGASVVTADVPVENGVVHVIDTVLIPGDQSGGNGGDGGS